jgi:hypothetical protein
MRGDLRDTQPGQFRNSTRACRNRFCVGGVSVQVAGEHDTDVGLGSLLNAFRVQAYPSDIDLQVRRVASLAPCPRRQLFDSGSVWRLYEHEAAFQFDFSSPVFGGRPYKRLFVDSHFRSATLHVSEECSKNISLIVSPLEYPLDELLIMHRLTQEKAIELHGCGIVDPDGASNLFIGHSGAGKSTTARLWTAHHDVQVLSDDRIIVREHRVHDENVRDDGLCKKQLREDSAQIFMYGTPWHGEAAFALPNRAPLQRIFILEHGCGNVITRLSRSQTVAELFARSFVPFHRHEYLASALSFLERVADSVPCYRYAFEPDERAVDRILNFHD